MYRTPTNRYTSFHIQNMLGKERKIKLPSLNINKKPTKAIENSNKEIIARKPTISLRRSIDNANSLDILTDNISKGTITFTSAVITKGDKSIVLPLASLKNILFTPEGEIIYNISQCLKTQNWNLDQGLYSNYADISANFEYPYFLPALQTSYIIIKSKAIYSRNLGKIIHAFESKGLTLRVTKFFENSGPQVFTIWEGSESETITKKIANSINPEFFEFPLK